MALRPYSLVPGSVEALVEIRNDLYRGDAEAMLQTAEVRRLLGPNFLFHRKSQNDHREFVATRGGKPAGHVSAIVNAEMTDLDGTPIGAVGFFESIEDYVVTEELLTAAVQWLREDKRLTRIWGPVQFDIWHGYRFKTRGFNVKPFTGEPSNKSYYPSYFEKFGFKPKWRWNSVWIADSASAESIIARGEPERQHLIDQGYRFTNLETRADFPILHAALMDAFVPLPGFTSLSYEEFEKLFLTRCQDLRLVTLVRDASNRVSCFAVAYPNAHAAVASSPQGKSAVFYLFGTTGERDVQDKLLARSTVYHTVHQCFHAGYDSVVLALMRKSIWSKALKVRHLDDALSDYVLYELEV